MKRRLVAVLLIAAAAAASVALATSGAAKVSVTEKEWGVKPLPTKVSAGKVTFTVKNVGKLDHELLILKTKTAAAKLPVKGATAVVSGVVGKVAKFKPGVTKTITLTLKPGHYVLLCNLPAHYQAGQRIDFSVS